LKDTDYDEWHRFSDDIENQKIDNKYPASQFDCSMENIKDTDVKIRYTIQYPGETKSSTVPIFLSLFLIAQNCVQVGLQQLHLPCQQHLPDGLIHR